MPPPPMKHPQQQHPQQQRPQPHLPPMPINQGFPPQPPMQNFPPHQSMQSPFMGQFPEDADSMRDPRGEDVPGMNTEEAESFFTLLAETDESKCISRLVCEMGANPESGGEFGQTIAEIIG